MSLGFAGAIVGTVAAGAIASRGARKASDTQAAAADRANEASAEIAREQMGLSREQFAAQQALAREQMARDRQIYDESRQIYDESIARQEPFRQAGLSGLQQYQNLIRNPFQYDQNAFSTERIMNDPGVAFRREQGQQQLDRRLAGTGNLYSGAALKEAQRFGQGLASQEYGSAYSRAADGEARRKDAYQLQSNQFASLAGIGQTANSASQVAGQNYGQAGQNYGQATAGQTNALGQFGQAATGQMANALGNYGNAFSNNTIGAANARAGNSMYQGNAWANALNQGISAYGRSGGGNPFMSGGGGGGGGYLGWDNQFGLYGNGGSGD